MFDSGTPNDGEDLGVDNDPLDRLLAAYEKAEPFAELRGLDAESADHEPSLDEPAGDAEEDRQQFLSGLLERDRTERELQKAELRRQRRKARARRKAERKERRRVEREEREAAELERARTRAAEEEDRRRARELRAVDQREEKRIAKERRERLREGQRRERREERARAAVERADRRRLLARAREEERREREHRAFLQSERERAEREAGATREQAETRPADAAVEPHPAPPEPPEPAEPAAPPAPAAPAAPAPPAPPAAPIVPPAAPASSAPRLAFERVRPLPEGWTPSPRGGPQYVRAPQRGADTRREGVRRANAPASRSGSQGRLGGARTRRAVAVVAALMTVGALAGGGWWYSAERDRIDHPDAWDARAAELVSFVEAERGRAFTHPVAIDLVTPTTFDDRWLAEARAPTDLVGAERDAAFLRSLGLTNAQGVLNVAAAPPLATARRAFYSPEEQRITMTGELDVLGRSALVAALTMALYDQAFGLPDHADDPAERLALAVAGGGAEITRDAYLDTLPPGDRASAEAAAAMAFASTAGPLTPLERLRAETARWAHPALARWGPRHDGDALVEEVPASEEQLLAPITYLLADEPVEVEQPELAPGERRLATGELGALHWLVMLAGRVDAMTALDAADGWAGDRWVAFDLGGRTCTRVAWIGDTERDTTEMRAALERWAAAVPGGDGRVTVDGDAVVVTSCDPGADALLDTANVDAAIATAVARTAAYTQVAALLEATDAEHAWCLADTALHELRSAPTPPVELALAASLDEPGRRIAVESACV